MTVVSLIAAMDQHHVIGIHNRLPWHLPADLKHFKKLTMGKSIVMGRTTFESIGKPLPNRRNIVISRNAEFRAPGCDIVHSIEQALTLTQQEPESMIIGGASLYAQTLPLAHRLYLTLVHTTLAEGDAFFPSFGWNDWVIVEREDHEADERNEFNYSFLTFDKKT